MRRDSEPVRQSSISQHWGYLRSKPGTDTWREEEVTKCEMKALIFFPLYLYCGSLIFHLHIFPLEMGYKFKSLIMISKQKLFESLSSVVTSLLSSLWMSQLFVDASTWKSYRHLTLFTSN